VVEFDRLIHEAESLEPLPQSTTRLAALLGEEDWDLKQIVTVVKLDEALTGRLLGAANSARSGPATAIATIDQAVMRLGPGTLLSLALAATVRQDMATELPEYGLEEGALWRHSVVSALAVEAMGAHCQRRIPPEAFAAALLHDIGKLVIARHLGPDGIELLRRDGAGLDLQAERSVLPLDHAELGAHVIRHWRLPTLIADAVRFHHHPLSAPEGDARTLAYVVALADAVARRLGEPGAKGPGVPNDFDPGLAERMGISQDGFEALCQQVEERFKVALAWYE
jgi:HD-like signal output (HDOD) protein